MENNNKKIIKWTVIVFLSLVIVVVFYYYVLPHFNSEYKKTCSSYGLNYYIVSGKKVKDGDALKSYCCNTNNKIYNTKSCFLIE